LCHHEVAVVHDEMPFVGVVFAADEYAHVTGCLTGFDPCADSEFIAVKVGCSTEVDVVVGAVEGCGGGDLSGVVVLEISLSCTVVVMVGAVVVGAGGLVEVLDHKMI